MILALNLERLAEELGWDSLLVENWGPAIVAVGLDFLQSSIVQTGALIVLAFSLGVWASTRLRRNGVPTADSNASANDAFSEASSYSEEEWALKNGGTIYNILVDFTYHDLWPAVTARDELHGALLAKLSPNLELCQLAVRGMESETREFRTAYNELIDGLTQSPGPLIGRREVMDHIVSVETQYWAYCAVGDRLADGAGLILFRDLPAEWEKWREAHNKLVNKFETIRTNSEMGNPLYRPMRQSRWGGIIERPPFA